MAEFCNKSAVAAAKFLRNVGNRLYFSTKYRHFRCFFFHRSTVIVEKFQPYFRRRILGLKYLFDWEKDRFPPNLLNLQPKDKK